MYDFSYEACYTLFEMGDSLYMKRGVFVRDVLILCLKCMTLCMRFVTQNISRTHEY